jgi:Ca2+/Na+ antiporter
VSTQIHLLARNTQKFIVDHKRIGMAQSDGLAFNIGAFASTLFLLEFGADKFITHTAAVASRIGVSEVIIGLLTAGAEWEEVRFASNASVCNNY